MNFAMTWNRGKRHAVEVVADDPLAGLKRLRAGLVGAHDAQHNIGCRPARRVITPDTIPPERLRRYGAYEAA